MVRIGLLSDTHNWLDPAVFTYLESCDEVWHAGDFGSAAIAEQLGAYRPLRGVYGNIDGNDIRREFSEDLHFRCEEVNIFMKHIGGYPGRYAPGVANLIRKNNSGVFISGHSHILKIMYDPKLSCLHINPGAAGVQGWHKMRTMVRFTINKDKIENCEVIELGTKNIKL